jgi:hypothetical protein
MKNSLFYTIRAGSSLYGGLWRSMLLSTTVILLAGLGAVAQGNKPAASLEQIRNGGADKPVDPAQWQNGNAGNQTAHYVEGHSIGYRTVLTNLPVNTHIELTLGYDVRHSSKNAIDFLTHFDRLEPHGQFLLGGIPHPAVQERVDPTIGFPQFRTSSTPSVALPPSLPAALIPRPIVNTANPPDFGQPDQGDVPGTAWDALSTEEKQMSIWGASFENITGLTPGAPIAYIGEANLTTAQSEQRIKVAFKTPAGAPGSKVTVILAWGGHIANRNDWGSVNGVPLSAGGISGSPYHMRLIDWSLGNLGQQDRSLSAAAVIAPPNCTISGYNKVCVSSINSYSTSVVADSYKWTILNSTTNTSGAYFTTSATSTNNLGLLLDLSTNAPVYVNAGPDGGAYTVKLVTTKNGVISTEICEIPVTVLDIKPIFIIEEATLCGTLDKPRIKICNPIPGIKYTVTQSTGGATPPAVTYDPGTGTTPAVLIFANLVAGKQVSVKAELLTESGAVICSATSTCTDTAGTCSFSVTSSPKNTSIGLASTTDNVVKETDEKITAYPVPFSNKATVEFKFEESKKYEVNLYDMKGTLIKQLKSGKAKAGELQQIEVDGQKLPEGMYLVRVVTSKGAQTIKLLKKE